MYIYILYIYTQYIYIYIYIYVIHTSIHPYIHPSIHPYVRTYVHTYITLHCIALHCITLHYITYIHYIYTHNIYIYVSLEFSMIFKRVLSPCRCVESLGPCVLVFFVKAMGSTPRYGHLNGEMIWNDDQQLDLLITDFVIPIKKP